MSGENQVLDLEILFAEKKYTYQRASLVKRFCNFAIDYLTILLFAIFVGVLLGIVFVAMGKGAWVVLFKNNSVNLAMSWTLIFWYYAICEYYLGGKTLGKFATQTSVKNISGQPASFVDILIRSGYRLIPLEPITILFGKKRGWHDSFSNTMVVVD